MRCMLFPTVCAADDKQGPKTERKTLSLAGGYRAPHGADSWSVLRCIPCTCAAHPAIVTALCSQWGCLFRPGYPLHQWPRLHGSARTLTSYVKGRAHPEIGPAVLKLFPEFPPLLPSASPMEGDKDDCTRTTFPMMLPMGSHAQPTRTFGHKESGGGPSEGDCCSCLPPNKSNLLWFEVAHVRLGLVQKLQDLPVIGS